MKDFDRRVVPSAGLDEVVVEESIMKQLKQIVQFEKARSVLSCLLFAAKGLNAVYDPVEPYCLGSGDLPSATTRVSLSSSTAAQGQARLW